MVRARVGGLRVALAAGGCLVAVLAAWVLWGGGRGAASGVTDRVAAVPEAARGVVSRTLGGSDRRFFVRRVAGGFALGRGAGGVTARFSRREVVVRAGDVAWSLGLRGVGRGARLVAAPAVLPVADRNQVRFERSGVSEWYVDGPLGLEQGFTLTSRPAGVVGAPVRLALGGLPAGVAISVSSDGRSVALTRGGLAVLRYRGLFASDARGRPLPARIVVSGRRLWLRVDDGGARYPLRIDPFVQVGKLTASNGAAGDGLGSAVAVSGDTVAVGAPNVGSGRGAVYVFVKPPGGWADATQTAKLTASDGAGNDLLGSSVAISGDTIVAGAPRATISGHQAQGAAYVFTKPPGGWADGSESAKLTAADGATSDQFGSSVAIDGSTIVVGAQWASPNAFFGAGAAYVFVDGIQQAKLLATLGQPEDNFGSSVGVSGDTVAIGAAGARNLAGAVYVFVKPAGGWANATPTATLTATDGGQGDHLGISLGVSGNTVAAGATGATVGAQRPGAVYVFVEPAGGWVDGTQTAKLSASDGAGGDDLGWSLTIGGNAIAAGAPGAGGNFQGAVYLFGKPAGGWTDATESAKLTAADEAGGDGFGESASVTTDGATLVGGSPQSGAGAAYVFTPGAGPGTRPTSTSVLCFPGTVAVGGAAGCRATVTDTGNGPLTTPTGAVQFSSDSHGGFGGSSCTLSQVGTGTAGCLVGYMPSAVDSGVHTITAAYPGDAAHSPSSGRASITVNPRPPVAIPPPVNAAPPVNTALPSISPARTCVVFLSGRLSCQPIPYTYTCNPGQWTANDPATPYTFEWQQAYLQTGSGGLQFIDWRTETTGQTFEYGPLYAGGSGIWRCAVTATGPGGSTVAYSPRQQLQGYLVVSPGRHLRLFPAPVDIRVTGIEVTQGTQEAPCSGCVFADPGHTICATCAAGTLPSRDQIDPSQPGLARYSGVTMAAGKDTVVRVFANFTDPDGSRALSSLTGATAQLQVLDSTGTTLCLPGAVRPACALNPIITPSTLQQPSPSCPLCVDLATRANPRSSFYFRIPGQYTYHRSLSFHATVTPPAGANQPGLCAGCRGNNFTLNSVPFKQPATVTIWPIPLDDAGVPGDPRTSLSLPQIFGATQTMFPNPVQVLPWDGTLDVEGLGTDDAAEAVEDRASDNNLPSSVYPVGVFFQGESGGLGGTTENGPGRLFTADGPPVSIVPDYRPVTGVAHEIGHGMALGHADDSTRLPGNPTADCGGGLNNQPGEGWPPDDEGRIQGVGLDMRSWSPLKPSSLPSTFVEGFDHQGNPAPGNLAGALGAPASGPAYGFKYYDFMSYCPPNSNGSGKGGVILGPQVPTGIQYTEPLDWISPHNWQRLLDYYAPPQALPAAADAGTAGATPLRVIATVYAGGATTIHDVTPGERLHLRPTQGSPYQIELRDAAGRLLTSVVAATVPLHTDGVTHPPDLMLAGTLPFSPGTAAVVITADGQELARRTRSAHAPAARFVSPRPGTRVGRARTTVVRWTEHDADGNRLSASVDYSADGGRTWRVVVGPVTGSSARIPSRLLSASGNARLRVRVSDGFNLTTVTSGRLRALGAPPTVQIIGAPAQGRVPETAMLPLEASAFDDARRPITGRHLTWYLGKRLIGSGEQVTAHGLRPGNTVIRLVATDLHDRRAQAILRLRVTAVAARYLLFYAPLQVPHNARKVRITAASTLPAIFSIAGKRYALGPRERTITVRIRPGRKLLLLPCTLRSPGGVIRGTYVAARGGR